MISPPSTGSLQALVIQGSTGGEEGGGRGERGIKHSRPAMQSAIERADLWAVEV